MLIKFSWNVGDTSEVKRENQRKNGKELICDSKVYRHASHKLPIKEIPIFTSYSCIK